MASVHVGGQGLVAGSCEWRLFMADQEKSGEPNARFPQKWVLLAAALSLIHSSHFRVSGIRMLHQAYKPSTSSSVFSSVPPKQKMDTAPRGGHQRQRRLWAGGHMMGELSGTLSTQAALTPTSTRCGSPHRMAF